MKRNQSCSISGRGRLIEDRKSRTKNSGKKPCTVSPEPERSPTNAPSASERERDQHREREQRRDAEHARLRSPCPAAKPTAR